MRSVFEQKAWGKVLHVFNSPQCAVSVLFTDAGAWCSRHYHSYRINWFIVAKGAIDVVRYTPDGKDEVSRKRLNAGDVEDVAPHVVHSFEVKEGGVVVEVYLPGAPGALVRHDDITRLLVGGRPEASVHPISKGVVSSLIQK